MIFYEDYNDIHNKNDVKQRIGTLEVIHLDLELIASCTFHDGDPILMLCGLPFCIKFNCYKLPVHLYSS